MASFHVGHNDTDLIIKVKQHLALLVLGGVSQESTPEAVGKCFRNFVAWDAEYCMKKVIIVRHVLVK
jgi:hypothetical protein